MQQHYILPPENTESHQLTLTNNNTCEYSESMTPALLLEVGDGSLRELVHTLLLEVEDGSLRELVHRSVRTYFTLKSLSRSYSLTVSPGPTADSDLISNDVLLTKMRSPPSPDNALSTIRLRLP